jgi:putative peptidoglycan lipid II flippase
MSVKSTHTTKPSVTRRLLRSTTVVASMTFLSRILGFMRDMVFARFFGAGSGFDAFVIAFKIPSFMRRLFAEGAFSQAFIPVLAHYQERKTPQEMQVFVSHIAGCLGLVLMIVTVFAIFASPLIVNVFAPGISEDGARYALAVQMIRITFPYLLFISLAALASAILNSHQYFALPAFTPVLLNITLILAAVVLSRYFAVPIVALAWGVFIAGILQFSVQLPLLRRLRLLLMPSVSWRDPGVRRVLKLMAPAVFGVSVAQVNILVDMVFASFLAVGSYSWLYYSDRLSQFPLGVFGVAIATVILPHLSRKFADENRQAFSSTMDWALRSVVIIGLPSSLGLLILSGPLLACLFYYGEFSAHDVSMASQSLMAFSAGVVAFMLIKVLAAGFYARQNIKTPVKIGVFTLIANIVFILLLISPLKHAGLALATTLAAYLNAGILAFLLLKREIYQPDSGWKKFLARILMANIAMAILLLIFTPNLPQWLQWGWQIRLLSLLGLIFSAMFIYFFVLWLLGVRTRDFKPNI